MSTQRYDPAAVPTDLQEWIDGEHSTNLTVYTSPVFLYASRFTSADLCHGLIYARERLAEAVLSIVKAMTLAEESYSGRINVDVMQRAWGPDVGLGPNVLEDWQWQAEEGEESVFSTDWNKELRLRQTISAFCKLRVKVERDDGTLRKAILWEQDEGAGPKPIKPVTEAQ
ncbi:hypothetical protein LTR36_010521 [Oleoguttula mirabilis]|uniref:Uncharacterized protein n=1 Tax=Oleoguttula mirabilis TaxID=1507867 RepID=A0AAV9J3X1_9PEZI|nr:hypothetical protein LTR36_010521 [Oleoguttula mirabilis]